MAEASHTSNTPDADLLGKVRAMRDSSTRIGIPLGQWIRMVCLLLYWIPYVGLSHGFALPPKSEHPFFTALEAHIKKDNRATSDVSYLLENYIRTGTPISEAKSTCTQLGMSVTEVEASKQSKVPYLSCTKWVNRGSSHFKFLELIFYLPHDKSGVTEVKATLIFRAL